MSYELTCHCGAVSIVMKQPIEHMTRCNCSICRRYGALWGYQKRHHLIVTAPKGALRAYRWGQRLLQFYHCTTCGCLTHYEHTDQQPDGSDRSAVNMRNIVDPAQVAQLPIRTFDGAGNWTLIGAKPDPDLFMSPSSNAADDGTCA